MVKALIGGAFLVATAALVVVLASGSRARPGAESACAWDERQDLALRGSARGDVDGDDRLDEVAVVANYGAPPGCRLALRVRLASEDVLLVGLQETLIGADGDDVQKSLSPRLSALATVDTNPGAEIVVNVREGASTGFARVFTVREHELIAYRVGEGGANQPFAYGAGGLGTGVDCWRQAASGYVVASEAEPNPRGWTVRRTVFRASGRTFLPVPGYGTARAVKSVEAFPELRAPLPFQRCTVVRGRPGN